MVALTIVSEHMVLDDALALLSVASPYPVLLHLENKKGTTPLNLSLRNKSTSSDSPKTLYHPSYRSQSSSDISKVKHSFLF